MSLLSLVENAPLSRIELDRRIWVGKKSEFFSCKSFFDLSTDSPNELIFESHKMVSKIGIPPKARIVSWLAASNGVNTCDLFQRKRQDISNSPFWFIL